MRIVTRKQLLEMKEGTIFSDYQPCIFGPLMVFGGKLCDFDFLEMSLTESVLANSSEQYDWILHKAAETGESFELDFDNYGRDGMFEASQLYAIWESKDLDGLIEVLKRGK